MRCRGFTLIEMILTIIVGSILVLGIAGFVELGSRGYVDTVSRQRIQTQAQFVLEKMTRELRHAVPNSIAISVDDAAQQCIAFYPIVYSGFYALDEADDKKLSFIVSNVAGSTTSLNFDGLKMIINPSNQNEFSAGIALSGSQTTITLSSPLASQSVAQRFYIYRSKVEYCLNYTAHTLTRNLTQVADSLVNGAFAYAVPTLQRGGVVHLSLGLEQNGEASHFEQDVQVLNVP
ncbi:PilW family protein [Vibrio fluvialis]|uniref:PilW family protein n=1 Tax=Vibrio fluvialis TaxID=676 RepID=UPI0004282343|nr:prepilin-type N-terminal cleavage/methylation domain-containing protein [Vibrio fluvialis]EKO3438815.1 prepilin-type N-terminal cleavage/methylation domain-containing protein [Vibrio fluvialis]EKO3469274.1 prepilin-type N-terminal cleavage/methylation domain-containing protein [Vibrio fluvialis]MBL4262411.1 prepilin-type N-terminal cleavage/methylation domain-containing protein [Vibrio fluvialis]MBY7873223.1 prepilin-type N-terminal cleavage/methylation domain-containing protein [Vibrio fluv